MFLKRLELHGFKTFATRTELAFAGGLTCVVGPNGSGKSNVADAVRWVLGEQSLRTLRCKRTEDVIFAGGAGRPPAGMAEVSITFDNETGWLDSAFQEVVVTRRAYRSGENEYLINRDRVRLRDVLDLLLKANVSPNGYTVIGQGMVDLALSLRPDERRALFEDAAGIRHHYVRVNEARGRLGTTEANLGRVRDVIAEIEPRLRLLERRAKQLRERDGTQAELRANLAAWYGHRWLVLRAAAEAAADDEREAAAALASARAGADETAEEQARIGQRQATLRHRLSDMERARADLTVQSERLARELALRHERAEAARLRADELRSEVAALESRARDDADAARAARAQVERLEADVLDLAAELRAAEGATDGHRERSESLRQRLGEAREAAQRLHGERASVEGDLARLRPRRDELRAEAARAIEAATRDEARVLAATSEVDRDRAALAELRSALAAREDAAARLREELAANRRAQEAIGMELAQSARARASVQGRLDVLTDAREGHAGYYQGVRAVLAAARGKHPQLAGVVGLVAALIQVPAELETAIEVALGSHLQDVVVERWEHAEAAVELLKRGRSGRATFLPLDTFGRRGREGSAIFEPAGHPESAGERERVGVGVSGDAPARDWQKRGAGGMAGVRGVASALVSCDRRYRPIAEGLLGRTLVVDDLAVARQALATIAPGWQIVTLAGEVVRANGAITGGANGVNGDRTLLARERERRELPERLATLLAGGQSLEGQLAVERGRQAELERRQRDEQEELRAHGEAVVRARETLAAATARIERLGREVEWSREGIARAEAELAELDRIEATALERLARLPAETPEQSRLIGRLQMRLADLDAATREQSERVLRFRDNVAQIESERRAQTRLLASHASRREEVATEIEARRRRIDELVGARATLRSEADEIEAAQGALADQASALTADAGPIEAELARLAEQARLIQSGEAASRAQLNLLADRVRQVSIAAQSARDQLASLAREASAELATLTASVAGEGESTDPLPDAGHHRAERGSAGSAVPTDVAARPSTAEPPSDLVLESLANPEATERRIELLKARLRGIGAVDATAGQEYDQTLARHAFLSGQAGDLVDASRLLKEAIGELETTMQARFEETFAAVAAAFRRHFSELFGGGTARLVISEDDGGVDIVAQPPGKRAQSLSLLSGGERSLTAIAILFAIMEVNPTPVCLLDEVDAALDDANIVRFAKTLRQLAQRTQFVVITHNRGTMETADALYGVSMLDRSTSRTVSLKLADIPA